MIYIDNEECKKFLANNMECMNIIKQAVQCMKQKKYHQPIKPYLDFPDKNNRIIAMPAYLGGDIDVCGIKWIASFPKNIEAGIPRANCITILNSTKTGAPYCIINSPQLSICRTAAVSGIVIEKYINSAYSQDKKYTIGIIGYGPIGHKHEEICRHILGDRLDKIFIYDKRKINKLIDDTIHIVESWEEVYEKADILIITTTAEIPYINRTPRVGKLTLNISLRDFIIEKIDMEKVVTIVDDWNEVNRKNTNIENLHKAGKITKDLCIDINDFLNDSLVGASEYAYFFNPMGMGIFDVAIAKVVYDNVLKMRV